MIADAPTRVAVFAGNRARGRIAVAVAADAGITRRRRVHEAGSLRVRFPNSGSSRLDAVIVNSAGGMTGGDRFGIDVDVGAGAVLGVTTAAAEKIYRSLGPDTAIDIKLNVAAGAALAWLPQETILFDRARLRRTIDIVVAAGAELLLAEASVFGRAAMGESVASGGFYDRWRVRLDGTLVFAENVLLDGKIAQRLAARAIAANSIAMATVIKIPASHDSIAATRALQHDFAGEFGVSAWNGIAVARFVAPDGAGLRRDLTSVLMALGGAPLPRLWLN